MAVNALEEYVDRKKLRDASTPTAAQSTSVIH